MFAQNAVVARALRTRTQIVCVLSAASILVSLCSSPLIFAQTRAAPRFADEARCEVADAAIPFGRIDLLQRSTWRAQGYVRIRCERTDASAARSAILTLSLVPGPRSLLQAGQRSQELAFDLFSDSNFSLPWSAEGITANSFERRFDWGVGVKSRIIEIPVFAVARPDKNAVAGEYLGAFTIAVAVR